MLPSNLSRLGIASALALLQACSQAPVEPDAQQEAPVEAAETPEITLNLPQEVDCACEEEVANDYTFLEKGYAALADGDHQEAVEYFRRYRRLESSAAADWESEIAIAYVRTLPDSPLHDPKEARKSFRDLNEEDWQSMELHQQTLLVRQSLESFLAMSRQVRVLREENKTLQEDLEKREEAIKRLRELTLGQKGAVQ